MDHLMHASSSHPSIRVRITLARPAFWAGSCVTGLLEVESDGGAGLIEVGGVGAELVGVEELLHPQHASKRILLHEANVFQGPNLPPSNLALPPLPSSPKGFYPVRTGRCSFPLSFPLLPTLPSTVVLPGGKARIEYVVRAHVELLEGGSEGVLVAGKVAAVVLCPLAEREMEGTTEGSWEGKLEGARGGKVRLILKGDRVVRAGGSTVVSMTVSNSSGRRLTDPKLSLARYLSLPSSSLLPLATDELQLGALTDACYHFDPGAACTVHFDIRVPEGVASVELAGKNGEDECGKGEGGEGKGTQRLFEVRVELKVTLDTGVVGESIAVSMPLVVVHPLALQTARIHPSPSSPAFLPRPASRTSSTSPFPFQMPTSAPVEQIDRPRSIVYQVPYGPAPSRLSIPAGYGQQEPHGVQSGSPAPSLLPVPPQRSMSVPPLDFAQFASGLPPDAWCASPSPPQGPQQLWAVPPGHWQWPLQAPPSPAPFAPVRPTSAQWAPAPSWPANSARPTSAMAYLPAPASSSLSLSLVQPGHAQQPVEYLPTRPASAMSQYQPHSRHVHSTTSPIDVFAPGPLQQPVAPPRRLSLPVDSNILRQGQTSPRTASTHPPGFVPYASPASGYSTSPSPRSDVRRTVISPTAHRLSRIEASTAADEGADDSPISIADELAEMALSNTPHDKWNKTLPGPPVPTRKVSGVKAVKPALLDVFTEGEASRLKTSMMLSDDVRSDDNEEHRRQPTRPDGVELVFNCNPELRTHVEARSLPASPPTSTPPFRRPAPAVASLVSSPTRSPSAGAFQEAKPARSRAYVKPTQGILKERERLRAVKGARVQHWLATESPAKPPVANPQQLPSPPPEDTRMAWGGSAKDRSRSTPADVSPSSPARALATPAPLAEARPRKSFLSDHFRPRPSSPDRSSTSTTIATVRVSKRRDTAIKSPLDSSVTVPAKFASRIARSQQQLERAFEVDQLARKPSKSGQSGPGSARGGKGGKVADVAKMWGSAASPTSSSARPPCSGKPLVRDPVHSSPVNAIKAKVADAFLNTATTPRASLSSTASLVAGAGSEKIPASRRSSDCEPLQVSGTLTKNFSKDRLRQLREQYGG